MCPFGDYRFSRRTGRLEWPWPRRASLPPAHDRHSRARRPDRRPLGLRRRGRPVVAWNSPPAPGAGGDGHLAPGWRRRPHRGRHGRSGLGLADRRFHPGLRGPGHQPVDDLALPARVPVGRHGRVAAAVVLAAPQRRRPGRADAAPAGARAVRRGPGRPRCRRRRGAAAAPGAGRSLRPPGRTRPRRWWAHPHPRAPGHALPPADSLPGPDRPRRSLRPDRGRPGPRAPRRRLAGPHPPLHPGGVGGPVGRAADRCPLGLPGARLGRVLGLGPGGERRAAALAGRHRLPPLGRDRRPPGPGARPGGWERRRVTGRGLDGGIGFRRLRPVPAGRLPHPVGRHRVRPRLRRSPGRGRRPPGRGGGGGGDGRCAPGPGPPADLGTKSATYGTFRAQKRGGAPGQQRAADRLPAGGGHRHAVPPGAGGVRWARHHRHRPLFLHPGRSLRPGGAGPGRGGAAPPVVRPAPGRRPAAPRPGRGGGGRRAGPHGGVRGGRPGDDPGRRRRRRHRGLEPGPRTAGAAPAPGAGRGRRPSRPGRRPPRRGRVDRGHEGVQPAQPGRGRDRRPLPPGP